MSAPPPAAGVPDDEARLRAARLGSQLLAGRRARSAGEVVDRLLAVQAQNDRGARLSVRSRSSGLTAADVDRALSDDRSLVVSWLQRGTLHLVAADDYWWLHPLTTPPLRAGNERRLRQEGVDEAQAERGVMVVAEATAAGTQTRAALRRRLDAAGVPTGGQALVHVLVAATLRGLVVRGPMVGGEQAFVSVEQWLGPPPPPLGRAEALGRLARRYLAGHGPATDRDLAHWAGAPLGDARRGLAALGDEIETFGDGVTLASGRRSAAAPAPAPAPRLLGPFDPILHGWVSRRPFVGADDGVVTANGVFRPVALVDGRVVATWGLAGGVITLRLRERVGRAALDALEEDALDVHRFLGAPPRPVVVVR